MVKRRAAPNPEAMMIAVRFAGGRRVDGEDGEGEDGDEEVFMVFLFLFLLVLFFFLWFYPSNSFERGICCCYSCVSFL